MSKLPPKRSVVHAARKAVFGKPRKVEIQEGAAGAHARLLQFKVTKTKRRGC